MGTRARPSQLRPHAEVRRQQAREGRRTALAAGNSMAPRQRYAWPADRAAIIAETVAAVRARRDLPLTPAGNSL